MGLLPDWKFKKVSDISADFLKKEGISVLLVDLDNTLAPYYHGSPSQETITWVRHLVRRGIDVIVYSNNKTDRPEGFAELLGTNLYVNHARKPGTHGIAAAEALTGRSVEEFCTVGDQIFTDVLLAKNVGCRSILVEPIKLANPLHIVRFILELPWRHTKRKKDFTK